ncbi:MAG: YebC/PmpR family DNA-binding transcriptional regulator [Bacteroidota bacterium]
MSFAYCQKKLEDMGIEPKSANLERIPLNTSKVDLDTAKKALTLIESLEDDDDVNVVFHNLEMTDELAMALEAE